MTQDDFRASIGRLGLSQRAAAPLLGVDERTVRRWANGERNVPPTVAVLLLIFERVPEAIEIARAYQSASPAPL